LRRIVYGALCCAALPIAALLPGALAQDASRGVLLVARPGMPDPNFSESVVLVQRGPGSETVGVIINRPLARSLAQVLPGERFRRFTEPLHFGGPVALDALIALFAGEKAPGPVITMIPGVHLALDPDTIDALLRSPPAKIRFFSGYSGWAPGQLDNEILRGDWFVLDADADVAFASDSSRLWQDLLRRARAVHARPAEPQSKTRRTS
jgi:putative transcriptional regulator